MSTDNPDSPFPPFMPAVPKPAQAEQPQPAPAPAAPTVMVPSIQQATQEAGLAPKAKRGRKAGTRKRAAGGERKQRTPREAKLTLSEALRVIGTMKPKDLPLFEHLKETLSKVPKASRGRVLTAIGVLYGDS